MSSAITGAWYRILTKLRLWSLVDPGLWTLLMVTYGLVWGFIRGSINRDTLGMKFDSKLTFEDHCFPCLSENWYFEVGETYICGHRCVTSLILCICSLNPWVLFFSMGVSCWILSSAYRALGVFDGQALPRSEFLVVVSSTSCCWF